MLVSVRVVVVVPVAEATVPGAVTEMVEVGVIVTLVFVKVLVEVLVCAVL